MKLSKAMQRALKKMTLGEQYSSDELDESMATLFALYERKLVDYRIYNGWYPRTGIDWQITELGEQEKESWSE